MLSYVTDAAIAVGLTRRHFAEPEPEPHEAIVEVHAYAVSRGELTLLRIRPNGFRPGQEVAGIVVRPAQDGSGPPLGARVFGLAEGKTWSERVAVHAACLGTIPGTVTMEQASALCGSGLTAYRALQNGCVAEGKRVLVTGASGAVGAIAVQLALRAGAQVSALVSNADRAEALRSYGSVDILASLEPSAGPFDLVLDGIGGTTLTAAIRRLAPGGLALTYGVVEGEPAPIAATDFRNAPGSRLQGFFVWLTDNATFGQDLTMLAQLVAEGQLAPAVGVNVDWADTALAVEALRKREVIGKAVLTVKR